MSPLSLDIPPLLSDQEEYDMLPNQDPNLNRLPRMKVRDDRDMHLYPRGKKRFTLGCQPGAGWQWQQWL